MYYNRLLLGAVAVNALLTIENTSADGTTTLRALNLSHDIEVAVANGTKMTERDRRGRWLFYLLVFAVLIAGLGVSIYKVATAPPSPPAPVAAPAAPTKPQPQRAPLTPPVQPAPAPAPQP